MLRVFGLQAGLSKFRVSGIGIFRVKGQELLLPPTTLVCLHRGDQRARWTWTPRRNLLQADCSVERKALVSIAGKQLRENTAECSVVPTLACHCTCQRGTCVAQPEHAAELLGQSQ